MKYHIIFVGDVAYSFTDEKTGKKHEGFTRKAVIARYDDNGVLVGIDTDKVSTDPFTESEVVSGAVCGQIFYDRFGRICGCK